MNQQQTTEATDAFFHNEFVLAQKRFFAAPKWNWQERIRQCAQLEEIVLRIKYNRRVMEKMKR